MMKHPSLASPMPIVITTLRTLFGMTEQGLTAYKSDDSGPFPKPFPHSNVAPEDRIDFFLHKSFNRAWSGPGLVPTTKRFGAGLRSRLEKMDLSTDWTHVDDFFEHFGKQLSASLTEAVFGSALLELHPDLIDDLWEYDDALPWLARRIPSFLMPRIHKIGKIVRSQLKDWYNLSRLASIGPESRNPDVDIDATWGSDLIRDLHKTLRDERGSHDDDALSSHDLALLWA